MSLFPSLQLPSAVSQGLSLGSQVLAYLNSPSIQGQGSLIPVRLNIDKYEETAQSEVSQLLVLDASNGSKQFYTDNVAPRPRTWNLSGYIPDPSEILGNALSLIPSNPISSVINRIGSFANYSMINLSLNIQAGSLWDAFYSRKPVYFRDRNHKRWTVAIVNLSISVDPVIRNKLVFSCVLKEIKFYSQLGVFGLESPLDVSNLGQTTTDALGVGFIGDFIP